MHRVDRVVDVEHGRLGRGGVPRQWSPTMARISSITSRDAGRVFDRGTVGCEHTCTRCPAGGGGSALSVSVAELAIEVGRPLQIVVLRQAGDDPDSEEARTLNGFN